MSAKGDYKLAFIRNYQLIKTIDSGNYAKVKEAIHTITHQRVALKIIDFSVLKDEYMLRNYKREALILSKLKHPNIVQLIEVIDTAKRFVMVLELYPENLCNYIRDQREGKLDECMARIFFRQMASAVSYMHQQGVIHRDLKLENILIDQMRRNVKICDFGLSNEWDKTSMLKTNCGSPEYSSPELHAGISYGSEVDVWALGVVLFAMVVGRLPFEVERKKPVSNQHRRTLFLEEMKHGIKTKKHQTCMSTTTSHFRDLTSKMLNPDKLKRIKMGDVEKHEWILFKKVELRSPTTKTRPQCSPSTTQKKTNDTPGINRPGTAKPGNLSNMRKNLPQKPVTQAQKHRDMSTRYVNRITLEK